MRKIGDIYCDFEVLTEKLQDRFANLKEQKKTLENFKDPEPYSWSMVYDNSLSIPHKVVMDNEEKTKADYGISVRSFIEKIESFDKDYNLWFNNSRKYDGHFIIPELKRMGYTFIPTLEDLEEHSSPYLIQRKLELIRIFLKKYPETSEDQIIKKIKRSWNRLRPKEYSAIIDKNSNIMKISIGISSKKKQSKQAIKNRVVHIYDNLSLFPSSIKNMGETIVKNYHGVCACYSNGECKDNKAKQKLKNQYLKKELSSNYEKTEKYNSVKELENDGNELEYLLQDSYILYKFHKEIEKIIPRKKWKMTIASMSYEQWIITQGEKIVQKMLESGVIEKIILERGAIRYKFVHNQKFGDKIFTTKSMQELFMNQLLPTKWLNKQSKSGGTIFEDIYNWYKGGLTHTNEEYRGQYTEDVFVIDLNSSYPAQMSKDTEVPIGVPAIGNDKNKPFKFYELRVKKKITNKKGLPFLINENAEKREYLKTLKPNHTYRFTSITLPYFLKHYKANKDDYTLTIKYSFNTTSISKIFNEYIEPNYKLKGEAKLSGNSILEFIVKLLINSLYGKFATKIKREYKTYDPNSDTWVNAEQKQEAKYYLPLAIAITELGRMNLVEAVGENYENVLYLDTDSIFGIGEMSKFNVELDPAKLGAWDVEFVGGRGLVRRPKQYIFKSDNPANKKPIKIAFSGINFNMNALPKREQAMADKIMKSWETIKITDYILGKSIINQLSPLRIPDVGIMLYEIEKNIKPLWHKDYQKSLLTEQKYFLKEHFMQSLQRANMRENPS